MHIICCKIRKSVRGEKSSEKKAKYFFSLTYSLSLMLIHKPAKKDYPDVPPSAHGFPAHEEISLKEKINSQKNEKQEDAREKEEETTRVLLLVAFCDANALSLPILFSFSSSLASREGDKNSA